jgi:hypothetical protein
MKTKAHETKYRQGKSQNKAAGRARKQAERDPSVKD